MPSNSNTFQHTQLGVGGKNISRTEKNRKKYNNSSPIKSTIDFFYTVGIRKPDMSDFWMVDLGPDFEWSGFRIVWFSLDRFI